MRHSTVHCAVRLIGGLSLLLPAAVQEKVCAWPVPSEPRSMPAAEPARPPASGDQSKPEKQPLTLAAMLPDAVAPRWPGHTQLTAVRRVRPLPATTWVDGPTWPDEQPDAGGGAVFAYGRHCPVRELSPHCGDIGSRTGNARWHVFQTSILRTGPPRA